MSGDIGIGRLLDKDRIIERDAIHVAVAPVIAACDLEPGESVRFVNGSTLEVTNTAGKTIGVVDPFLKKTVEKGDRFWLFLQPGSITSLRHDWTHPAFKAQAIDENTARIKDAQAFMDHFAESIGSDSQEVINHATWYLDDDEYWCEGGRFESQDLPDEFWENYEILTGRPVPPSKQGHFFSCSC